MLALSAHANWVRLALNRARLARRMDPKIAIRTIDAVRLAKMDGVPVDETLTQQVEANHDARIALARRRFRLAKNASLLAEGGQPMKRLRPYQAMVAQAERASARQRRHDKDVAAENALETRRCTLGPKEPALTRYPIDWLARQQPTVRRCECEACFGARKLRAWLDNDGQSREAPDFEETCQALSAQDRCRAAVCFPDAIDRAAIGPLSVTVNGMPGRTLDWLDTGRLREDGTLKATWVGKIVTPGPFESMAIQNWDVNQWIAHRCTTIAVHEGSETEHGYLAHPRWYADEERLEREYAGLRRADLTEPLDPHEDDLDEKGRVLPGWYPDNVLKDEHGRVVLGLSAYEYFRRGVELHKFLDPSTGRPNGMALGVYMPSRSWRAFLNTHRAHQTKLRERAKITILLRSLRFDASAPSVVARIEALDKRGREDAIKALYRKHNERGIAIPS